MEAGFKITASILPSPCWRLTPEAPCPSLGSLRRERRVILPRLRKGGRTAGVRERDSGICSLASGAKWGNMGFYLKGWLSHDPEGGGQARGSGMCIYWAQVYDQGSKEEGKRGSPRERAHRAQDILRPQT